MWILLWSGQPRFWLCGASTLTIGRKGTDVTITDDQSISRLHCTVTVGMSAVEAPAPITFTDSSKYGCQVTVDGNTTTLPQGVDWSPSITCVAVKLALGTHGASFDCVWDPFPMVVHGIAAADRGAVVDALHKSGGCESRDVVTCRAVLVASLEPTALVVAALCLAKPLVGVDYLTKVNTRLSPKIPPPALDSSLALPTSVHIAWATIVASGGGPAGSVDPAIFLPRIERKSLFSGISFVCIQGALFKELSQYISHAGGRIVLAELPPLHSPASAYEAAAHRYRSHVLVHTTLAAIDANALDALQLHGLRCVEYTQIIRSVLLVEPLPMPSDAAAREFGGGEALGEAAALSIAQHRLSAAQQQPRPLGSNSLCELEGNNTARPSVASPTHDRRRHSSGTAADVSAANAKGHAMEVAAAVNGGSVVEEDLIVSHPIALPADFPCFMEPHAQNQVRTSAEQQDGGGGAIRGKCFVKQRCIAAAPVAYEAMGLYAPDVSVRADGTVHPGARSAAIAIDADDIVPMHAVMERAHYGGGGGAVAPAAPRRSNGGGVVRPRPADFDADDFVARVQHAAAEDVDPLDAMFNDAPLRRVAPPQPRPKRAPPQRSAAPARTAAAAATGAASPPRAAAATSGGGGGIFDIDNLY